MTVKEASDRFNISKDEIRKLCRESQEGPIIYVRASKNIIWNIDDDTKIIMKKSQIFYSLLELLKHKNNPYNITSRRTFPNDEISVIVFDYLCSIGYVGVRNSNVTTLTECLSSISLTDEGLSALLSPAQRKQNENVKPVIFNINNNFSVNAGLVNI